MFWLATLSEVTVYEGRRTDWGGPVRRLDLAANWRLSAHLRLKLELNHRRGEDNQEGSGWGGAAQFLLQF